MIKAAALLQAVQHCETVKRVGHVVQFYGLVVESTGPDVYLGEICEITAHAHREVVTAEVVGFREGRVLLMPYGRLDGIRVGCEVTATGKPATVTISEHLIGRVIDAFGRPLDGKPLVTVGKEYFLCSEPTNPLARARTTTVIQTGVKAIDVFLTLGKGQRVGIFAGSGVGKSTLLGMIARNTTADINVIALIGERGREVVDFIEDNLGPSGLARSVVIVATADQPALVRVHAALMATAIAEYFRDRQKDVMLFMDSVTRYAMAQREIGLAVGEPPTSRGYTPSTFSALPRLVERAGNFRSGGSITALYTVLVEGDDFNEPVSDNMRAILDGHIQLTRKLANKGQFPAVDLMGSNSRLFFKVTSGKHQQLVQDALKLESLYQDAKEMIDLGAYQPGKNLELDRAIRVHPRLRAFLAQSTSVRFELDDAIKALTTVLGD